MTKCKYTLVDYNQKDKNYDFNGCRLVGENLKMILNLDIVSLTKLDNCVNDLEIKTQMEIIVDGKLVCKIKVNITDYNMSEFYISVNDHIYYISSDIPIIDQLQNKDILSEW